MAKAAKASKPRVKGQGGDKKTAPRPPIKAGNTQSKAPAGTMKTGPTKGPGAGTNGTAKASNKVG